jgi:ribosomal protein L37E
LCRRCGSGAWHWPLATPAAKWSDLRGQRTFDRSGFGT